ncbi:MAG: hypothetical protein H6937_00435 [Burkholderiales bacterium]|nr:hypothetical protein [Burkholderiales bacterium]MDR4518406.1 hypothetical protein [Nitrosomonas sp.]
MLNIKNSENDFIIYTVVILLLVSGIGLAGLGAYISETHPKLSPLLLAVGGTFFGGVFTLILSFYRRMNVLDLLRRSLDATFRSTELEIDKYRKKFYQYHLTETKNDGWQWMYVGLNFTHSDEVGTLKCRAKQVTDEDKPYPGNVEAGVRRNRFIVLRDPDSGEPTVVAIFPYMGKGISPYHSGICVMETWLENPVVTRVILGEEPINNWDKLGKVSPEIAKECEKIWKTNFKSSIEPLKEGMSTRASEQNSAQH